MASFFISVSAILFVFYFFVCGAITTNNDSYNTLMVDKHNEWMTRFQRMYADDNEKAKRYKIFKDNVEFIESFNRDENRTFVLGVNEFSDLTHEEFLAFHNKYVMPKEQKITTFRYEGVTDLPSHVDWREKGAVTSVKNQSHCGSCWAFGTVAAIEGIYQINTGYLVSFSEQELLDCNIENNGCAGGSPGTAYEFVMQNGLTTYQNYPYYNGTQYSCNMQSASDVYVGISDYEVIPQNDEYAMMQAVAHQPISFTIDSSCFQHYAGGIFTNDCGRNNDHVMTMVGYGTDEKTGMKYWLAKNSWGEKWGEKGYIRMPRDVDSWGGFCGLALYPSYPIF